MKIIREKKPVQANFPTEKIMKLQGFTDNNKPTLAGIMMFAEYPQAFFPQLCITAVSVPGYEIGDPGEDGVLHVGVTGHRSQLLPSQCHAPPRSWPRRPPSPA